ncbi:hypothetical protein [Longirhabdus pacifica]|uniref:hypothetical protein n=1 Tax=Longirhabdus pacifica TaxID=2305227 RepID=UPI001009172B|nr:hypothetical protein [Longirhabdus pacifica]
MAKKQLPIHTNPGLATECYHNFRLSILMTNPQFAPWYYNHFVNLQLQSKDHLSIPFVGFEEHLDIYTHVLEEETIDIRAYSPTQLVSLIKEALHQQQYIVIYLNWKHIASSNFYKGNDLIHDAIIYGYDDNSETFDVIAFEVNGKAYDTVPISYAQCEQQLLDMKNHHLTSEKWFAFYGFPLSTIKVQAPYLSHPMSNLFFSLERGNMQAGKGTKAMLANGPYVNQYLSHFFSSLMESGEIDEREHGLWNITVVKMIQHKTWMLRRIEWLKEVADLPILQQVEKKYERAKRALAQIRAHSFKYQKTLDKQYFISISQQFQTVFEQERRAVPLLMEYLIDTKLKL